MPTKNVQISLKNYEELSGIIFFAHVHKISFSHPATAEK